MVETAIRAAKQATEENKTSVGLDHLENVLPQIVNINFFIKITYNLIFFSFRCWIFHEDKELLFLTCWLF